MVNDLLSYSLFQKSSTAMPCHTTIGIYNNLASCYTTIAVRTAYDKRPVGLMKILYSHLPVLLE
mgnify:CR=1 FL=1